MKKPNIIYVFPDQYRIQALSLWQEEGYKDVLRGVTDPVFTPNIDRFAKESLIMTQAVSNFPLCSPYRGMLLSGRFPEQNGVKANCNSIRPDSLREDIVCLTDVLASQGYNIGYLGKYHLDRAEPHFDAEGVYVGVKGGYYADGSQPQDIESIGEDQLYDCCWNMATPKGPKRHGVDFWYSYGADDTHSNPHYWDTDCVKQWSNKWSPIHEADVAISYINNHNNERDTDNPFCLFVSMNPPHSPYNAIEHTDAKMFHKYYSEDKVPDIWDLLNRPNVPKDADALAWVRYYFASVSGVDREFGRILDALEASGEKDNTIVVFSADHGDTMGSHNQNPKNSIYEESYRIPYIVRYPKVLDHRIEDLMFSGPDVMPTLLGLAGMKEFIPEDLDGTDYSEVLVKGEDAQVEKPKSTLYLHEYPSYQRKGVRTDRYSFVIERDTNGEFKKHCIFDNHADPYQMNNLEFEDLDPETLEFLKSELGYWLKRANDSWYQERVFEDFIIYPK